ncbi:GAF domain-containing sensor histidine kinase [Demequina mangrovi]|uniref:GAF domain-containing protein n=1 Tax=Demequina mangrovi TaxID=1043493 RepID=A0A1H6V3X6_9MICO|nr:GAF domain-containing protein [Demequina mangrovi]SEI99283.1 GAF domain-containing protein [Demequina mangrovi]
MTDPSPQKESRLSDAMTDAIVSLNLELDLDHTLDMLLTALVAHTGAKFAAINVLDDEGISVDFHYTGMPEGVWEHIRRAPNAVGVLGQIPDEGTLVLADLTQHQAFQGMPKHHPPMGSFLGTALRVRGSVFGYLYLASKPGEFTADDEAAVEALAAAASVAIDNAVLYEKALARERWLTASQDITTALLADPGDEEVFETIVRSAKDLAGAVNVALVLPGIDETWTMEITAGPRADELLGLELPQEGRAIEAIRSGEGVIATEPPGSIVLEAVQEFGPTMYAPLSAEHRPVGLLMLWRDRGMPSFSFEDLEIAQRFATQAAMALSVAELSHVKQKTTLLEERQRLADDLHDFVSQELFATAMQIESISSDTEPQVSARLLRTLDHVKRAQREVRGVMSSLAGHRTSEPISERIRREIVMGTDSLGFAPRVQVDWAQVSHAIAGDPSLSDDVVAVVRELLSNVARHAQATSVYMGISGEDGRVAVTVSDDGIGPGGATNRHSGTSNLANRALRRNGTFTLAPSRPGSARTGTVAEWNVEAAGR